MKNELIGIILATTLVAIVFAGYTGEDEEEEETDGIEVEYEVSK